MRALRSTIEAYMKMHEENIKNCKTRLCAAELELESADVELKTWQAALRPLQDDFCELSRIEFESEL